MTRDGEDVVALTHSDRDVGARWSPDGRSIAFIRERSCFGEWHCPDPANLYIVEADGQGLRRLTSHAKGESLLWSPDGRLLLFTETNWTADEPKRDVELVGADGQHLRRLATDAEALAWSPDRSKILFSRLGELWLMDADGGRETRLPFNRPGSSVIAADWDR